MFTPAALHIEFPSHSFATRQEGGRQQVFDELRKLWVRLTPEEWVRQHFIQYLLQVKQYPAALIAIEKQITLGELNKRFDILVYDRAFQPWLMVECKAPEVALDEKVIAQLLRYNIALPVQHLVITNGTFSFGFEKNGKKLLLMRQLPDYGNMPSSA